MKHERILTHGGEFISLTPDLAPVAPLLRLLARMDRRKVEAFAEVSVAFLDLCDGDPDDEVDRVEDDFFVPPPFIDFGPGCEASDAGEDGDDDEEHDGREDERDQF